MKAMTDLEIKKLATKLVTNRWASKAEKNSDCEYFREKCTMTTQTSCVACEFFRPRHMALVRMLTEELTETKEQLKDSESAVKSARMEIKRLQTELKDVETRLIDAQKQLMSKRKLYKYGMRLRGFSPGAQPMPESVVERRDDPTGIYYDILVYDVRLTGKQTVLYDLDYLGEEDDEREVKS